MNAVVLAEPLARSGEAAKSGPIGLAVILLLCVVSYFLFKSMSKHLRKVREQFPPDDAPARPVAPQPPAKRAAPTAHRVTSLAEPGADPPMPPDA